MWEAIIEVGNAMLSLWILVAAPFIGSFLGVVVTRFETSESVFSGRSKCSDCHDQLGVRDLIPVISWLVLKGRCRSCGATISWIHPVSEVGALIIAVWAFVVVDEGFLVFSCLLGWALMTIGFIDIRVLRIPDPISGFILMSGLLVSAVFFRPTFADHLLGIIAGFATLFFVRHAYYRFRGKHGLGRADERLLGAGGAWIGVVGTFSALFLAALFGILVVCVATMFGRKIAGTDAIPFGPFLAGGVWLTWLYGPVFIGG